MECEHLLAHPQTGCNILNIGMDTAENKDLEITFSLNFNNNSPNVV